MILKAGCIDKIYSVSAVLGGPKCNAKCPDCAGRVLRPSARQVEGHNKAPRNIVPASRLALNYGAWTLSLTSSGEPTMYPDAITDTLKTLRDEHVYWPYINLFTNGINIGRDPVGMVNKMWEWKKLGLTSVVISIHSTDHETNAKMYGNPDGMIPTPDVLNLIRKTGLCARVVMLLGRDNIGTLKEYKRSLDVLHDWGVGLVTSWQIKTNSGERIPQTPSWWEMAKIRTWIALKNEKVLGHAWNGVVYNYRGMNCRLTDYVTKHKSSDDFLRQLVLLPGGKVSFSWYQEGRFCLD
jgi:MoaA/NifB/PqqE/SkfB family radical SAM enzyme